MEVQGGQNSRWGKRRGGVIMIELRNWVAMEAVGITVKCVRIEGREERGRERFLVFLVDF